MQNFLDTNYLNVNLSKIRKTIFEENRAAKLNTKREALNIQMSRKERTKQLRCVFSRVQFKNVELVL